MCHGCVVVDASLYYDTISAFSRILFVWVVGWGMRFRTPPKCADAVYCVRALGGWAETQRWGGIREVGTFCGGTEQKHIWGNSKSHRRYEGGWLFIIIRDYAKKNFSHNLYYDIIAALSCILFVWVVGWGMRFRTPPKCADAVDCVRALGGGRKRRGGMAVCLKGRIVSSANR